MKELIDILHNEGLTLVIRSADRNLHRFDQHGVKDLLTLVATQPQLLKSALVADKAVGKAAAACMAVGGISAVHADVMSEAAFNLLRAYGIAAEYDVLVDHITNRAGDGWCPMEQLSRDENDPMVIIQKIRNFLSIH